MAPRRPSTRTIGATQSPDFGQLESIDVDRLEARFELEDVQVFSASLVKVDAGSGRVGRVHLKDVDLSESKLRGAQLIDVLGERVNAANGDWGGAQIRRTLFSDARLTGLSFAEARMEDVSFKGCRLDYANFRHSAIEQVSFEDCVLTGADFQGARINATLFSGCQLQEADFSKADLSLVDLRGSELALAGSVLGLGGAIIDPLQLMELAQTLAQELGITVEDADLSQRTA
ncbi:MAG: pentapeptide repeat-containing protein [Solirubrobacteraceae bacterium]